MLALGTLTKGPVAPVLCGAIALIWILIERRGREIARMPWALSIAIYCAITVPWFVLAAYRNPGFLHFFFVHEHVQRYLENTEHGWGPWFFLPIIIGGIWPWFFFVPMGLRATESSELASRSALRLLVIWFLVIFVFFSIPRAKLGSSILPAIPALSMLAGLGMYRLWSFDARAAKRILGRFSAITLLAAIAIGIAASVLAGKIPHAIVVDVSLIATLLAAMAIISFLIDRDAKRPGAFVMTLALATLLIMGVATRARKDGAAETSYRGLAMQLKPLSAARMHRRIVSA